MAVERDVRRRLTTIANQLDRLAEREAALYAERVALWAHATGEGTTPSELAAVSRVAPVTVRQLIARNKTKETKEQATCT